MAETTDNQINIARIRQEIRSPVTFLTRRLLDDLDDNLLSLCVVGSALTDDFHPKYSDINTVLVVKTRSHKLLQLLAGYGSKMGRMRLRAPLLMTQEYIRQSLDTFSVEFMDFQFNHSVVYGSDPFGELTFHKKDVRLQCERQLKASLIKLRQGYVQSLGKPKIVGELLIECAKELAILLRAMLWLTEVERDRGALPTLKKAAQEFDFDASAVLHLMELKIHHHRCKTEQVEILFEKVYQTVDHLARRVDQMEKQ